MRRMDRGTNPLPQIVMSAARYVKRILKISGLADVEIVEITVECLVKKSVNVEVVMNVWIPA